MPAESPYVREVRSWASKWSRETPYLAGATTHSRWIARQARPTIFADSHELRAALLDFILDLADPTNATRDEYLSAARRLVHAAAEEIAGVSPPLVVDPFAGGGALPLEALRVGAEAFALDLNPVAVLLNKVAIEYVPAYGARLRDEVRRRGEELLRRTRDRLGEFYPGDASRSTTIAYLWARTLHCQGPGCGVEIPLLSNLGITKRRTPPIAAFLGVADRRVTISVREVSAGETVPSGTARGGRVACPVCGYTMKPEAYRRYAREQGLRERLFGVVTRDGTGARAYRSAETQDYAAARAAEEAANEMQAAAGELSPFPNEALSQDEPRRLNVRLYGFTKWGDLFNPRQKLALATFGTELRAIGDQMREEGVEQDLIGATRVVLSLALSNLSHYMSNMSTYLSDGIVSAFSQSSAIAMRADYAEANPLMPDLVGGFDFQLKQTLGALDHLTASDLTAGTALTGNAVNIPLANESADAVITDPPYYFAIPYADLSDLFYVWLRRFVGDMMPELFADPVTPKAEEAIQNLPHSESTSSKDREHFTSTMRAALKEARRILKPHGIAVIVFANATTEGWEALLQAVVAAGWVVTASWPLETERADRMLASRQSVLASSVHLVCRPRSAALDEAWDAVGDWREVLHELPTRMESWMARLAREGIVGADAIFACLGPALELYSRYSRVERASGEPVTLDEYLAHVWAAVAQVALGLVFDDADASSFEEDARLTAMWLWTVAAGAQNGVENKDGFTLEYDSARKLAQGLGAHLEDLDNLVEIKRNMARLRLVRERAVELLTDGDAEPHGGGESDTLFARGVVDGDHAQQALRVGRTVLDRVHQTMLLFGEGRSDALRSVLLRAEVGRDPRFSSLAQALSVLYPSGSDEKRWIDGVQARKRTMGL
jgi:adenine-specific DNA methylase